MKTAAIICEYNPFHNGHAYQIEKTREKTGANIILALMSGNYVQRGTPALMEKQLRTKAALSCGADIVIELPLWFACNSAPYFASGAISLLNFLGIVDFLSFGSECENLSDLKNLTDFLVTNEKDLSDLTAHYVKDGHSYPKARELALFDLCGHNHWLNLIREPNNLLGIEYLKALRKTNSHIVPVSIPRKSSSHHQQKLQHNSSFSSASAIRNVIEQSKDLSDITPSIPEPCISLMHQHFQKDFPVTLNDFSGFLKFQALHLDQIIDFWEISSDFQDIFQKHLCPEKNITQLIHTMKSKNLTWSRISRNLMHILLGMKNMHRDFILSHNEKLYYQILGFRKESSHVIAQLKQHATIPMVRHCRAFKDPLSPYQEELLCIEQRANQIYHIVLGEKFHISWKDQQIIV